MRKTYNPTYLDYKKVGWNEKITKFSLTDKIPNFTNAFYRCVYTSLWLKVLIFQGIEYQTVWEV